MFFVCVELFSQFCVFFFFKQKTAYEMRISDWSSDVCSSDLKLEGVSLERDRLKLQQMPPVTPPEAEALDRKLDTLLPRVRITEQIGRASCRERVSVRVDLGGRRTLKKKNQQPIEINSTTQRTTQSTHNLNKKTKHIPY